MPKNIEIKARLEDRLAVESRLKTVATDGPVDIRQDDTFFRCETGRLKLRMFSANDGEVIYYRRPDQSGPKESFYVRASTHEPELLREALCLALGEVGRVRKVRALYMVGRTRVHLDRVEGLGDFLELEVVLGADESTEAGRREAAWLMDELRIAESSLVEGAYVDLIRE